MAGREYEEERLEEIKCFEINSEPKVEVKDRHFFVATYFALVIFCAQYLDCKRRCPQKCNFCMTNVKNRAKQTPPTRVITNTFNSAVETNKFLDNTKFSRVFITLNYWRAELKRLLFSCMQLTFILQNEMQSGKLMAGNTSLQL